MISHKLPVRDPEPAEIGASLISLAPALPEELLLQQGAGPENKLN